MTTKTAIIGLGIMGRRMLEQMLRNPGYTPVALWDPDADARAATMAMVPDAPFATSAEAAIDAADLVYLACPPAPRKAYALRAAQAGKAVFLEKPLGVDIAENETLVAELEHAGVPAAVNFVQATGAALAEVSEAAATGALGDLKGADIIVTYPAWPRAWQVEADWLRFRAEGGMTREVISHFIFFCERVLGPLTLVWARPSYPENDALCETHMTARLETAAGQPVTIMASVGGAQPDRQEVTIKGSTASRRVTEFHKLSGSTGGAFEPLGTDPTDPRATSLQGQLDALTLCMEGKPHALATPAEALSVQRLIEGMLAGKG